MRQSGGPDGAAQSWQALLRGGTLHGAVAGVVTSVVSLFWGGGAALGAALGAVVAVGAFAVGPLLLRTVSQWSPPAVMAAALGAYLGIVFVLGLLFAVLDQAAWLAGRPLGVSLLVCSVASGIGQMRALAGLRLLAFGAETDTTRSAEGAGQGEEQGAPHTRRD